MSHRYCFTSVEAAIIGRTLCLVAQETDRESHRDYLERLARRFDPKGDNVNSDEAKMVDWLIGYASAAGAKVQELQGQLNQIQSEQQAAQPTVDRLTDLYNKNQQATAPAATPTADATSAIPTPQV